VGLSARVHSDLAIFCHFFAFRHKKYFFLPLLTFIHLYPPLLGWSGRKLALTIKLPDLFSRDSSAARHRPGNLTVSLLLILASEPHLLIKVNI